MGLSRQAGIGPKISPGCNRLISTFIGAPAAKALALGFHDPKKGTAKPATPPAPTAAVAPRRKFRRPELTLLSLTTCLHYSRLRPYLGMTKTDRSQLYFYYLTGAAILTYSVVFGLIHHCKFFSLKKNGAEAPFSKPEMGLTF
jgi:hypothetical protein